MSDRDHLGATLDELVPRFDDEAEQWEDVLRRAEALAPPAHGRRRAIIAAVAALAALCAIVLADPFGGDDRSVIDRALAAVGDGPVLHVVTRTPSAGTLVDLDSGLRTRLYGKRDTWFDPKRGLRITIRLRGFMVEDLGVPTGRRLRNPDQALQIFTQDYRAALRSGRARVRRTGVLAGKPVYWIRVEAGPRAPRGAPCARMFCNDVAISRETYKPVYVRFFPGRPGEWILTVESLPAGSGAIPGPHRTPRGYATLPTLRVDRPKAQRILGAPLAWPGARVAGLRLTRMTAIGSRSYVFNGHMRRPRWGRRLRVIRLVFRDGNRALVVNEARRAGPGIPSGPVSVPDYGGVAPLDYVPPEGSMLLTARRQRAILRERGLVVGVVGSSPGLVRAAVRALRR